MTSSMEDAPENEMQLSSARMMELAELASRLIVERLERLPTEPAWRGGTRAELEATMREDPPEEGRPPATPGRDPCSHLHGRDELVG